MKAKKLIKVPDEITPCQKKLRCEHDCGGVAYERRCLPCLEPECRLKADGDKDNKLPIKDDLCNICFTSELGAEPSVKLACGHIFHAECVRNLLKHKWSTLRINFEFMACPACKHPIDELENCPQLQRDISELLQFKEEIAQTALKAAAKGKIDTVPTRNINSKWHGKRKEYLAAKAAFYECGTCKKPFFGGMIDCERELNLEATTKKEDLKCTKCNLESIGVGQYNCPTHGHHHITWKCHRCCSEALFRCGTAYLCDPCHRNFGKNIVKDCGGKNCPLGVPHPPASNSPLSGMFPLGCSLCRVKPDQEYKGANFGIEEIKLDQQSRQETRDLSQIYNRHNPLNAKVAAELPKAKANVIKDKRAEAA